MQKITSDAELLEASLAGSREAFGAIVQRYQSLICGITYSATGDFGKSEELAQETFIRAWKGLSRLKDSNRFQGWLCTIARNLVRKSIKREKRDVIDSAQSLEKAGQVKAQQPGPGQLAISKEQADVVWRALQEIPESYREPMVLFYREQRSVRQVAAGLGLSEDLAKQRLSRGRRMLKESVAAIVEETLGRTGPGKVFTVAVVAALPAVTVQTASAAVAGMAVKGSAAAKTAGLLNLLSVALGPLLGMLGGLFGTWVSIKHTKSKREKWFMIKISLFVWAEVILLLFIIGLLLILALKGAVGKKVYWVVFIVTMTVHIIWLVPTVIWVNRRQRQIQKEDGTYIKPEYQPRNMSKANVYGAFGGSIFGPVCWIFVVAAITKDWLIALSVLIFVVILFVVSTKICLREPGKFWRIVITDMMAIALLALVVVNLRWEKWMAYFRESSGHNLRYARISLWLVNVAIGAVLLGLMLIFLVSDLRRRRLRKKEHKPEKA
jgi:RNA polymerase sigma factor (sigma-70 family)